MSHLLLCRPADGQLTVASCLEVDVQCFDLVFDVGVIFESGHDAQLALQSFLGHTHKWLILVDGRATLNETWGKAPAQTVLSVTMIAGPHTISIFTFRHMNNIIRSAPRGASTMLINRALLHIVCLLYVGHTAADEAWPQNVPAPAGSSLDKLYGSLWKHFNRREESHAPILLTRRLGE